MKKKGKIYISCTIIRRFLMFNFLCPKTCTRGVPIVLNISSQIKIVFNVARNSSFNCVM